MPIDNNTLYRRCRRLIYMCRVCLLGRPDTVKDIRDTGWPWPWLVEIYCTGSVASFLGNFVVEQMAINLAIAHCWFLSGRTELVKRPSSTIFIQDYLQRKHIVIHLTIRIHFGPHFYHFSAVVIDGWYPNKLYLWHLLKKFSSINPSFPTHTHTWVLRICHAEICVRPLELFPVGYGI